MCALYGAKHDHSKRANTLARRVLGARFIYENVRAHAHNSATETSLT
jgi:hypothetical protein